MLNTILSALQIEFWKKSAFYAEAKYFNPALSWPYHCNEIDQENVNHVTNRNGKWFTTHTNEGKLKDVIRGIDKILNH